jgi:hypothetical protein
VCDAAGNCDDLGIPFVKDTVPPQPRIVWPPHGTLTLDNVTLPLLPDPSSCMATFAGRALAAAAAVVCPALSNASPATSKADATTGGVLGNSTILAGRVPVIVQVQATGGGALGELELFVGQGVVGEIGDAKLLPSNDPNVAYYEFMVDVPQAARNATATGSLPVASTVLGVVAVDFDLRAGFDARPVLLIAAEPSASVLGGFVGEQPLAADAPVGRLPLRAA